MMKVTKVQLRVARIYIVPAPNTAFSTFTILIIDRPQWVTLKKIKIRYGNIHYVGKYMC